MNGGQKAKSWAPSNWQFLRFETLKRDKFTCQYCGRRAPEVKLQADHIVPRCEGGKDELRNLVTACADCNGGKWGRSLAKVAPTLAAIFSATQRKKRSLRKLLEELKREELECYEIEKEISRIAAKLPKTQSGPKRSGVIVIPKQKRR
jgi:hypothetical protein